MKRYCLVFVLAFVAAFASDSRGQSKQPSPKTGQQSPAQQERGTEQSPFIIKVIPAEKSKDDLSREDAKDKEKLAVDDRIASLTGDLAFYTKMLFVATAALALITVGLVVAGFKQLKDTRRSIVAAESSAKTAEKALTELEAPFISIKVHNNGINWGPARNITFGDLKFTIVNYGRTPAHILELVEGVEAVPLDGGQPEVLDTSKKSGNPMPYGVIAPPNGETQEFKTIVIVNFFEGPLAEF